MFKAIIFAVFLCSAVLICSTRADSKVTQQEITTAMKQLTAAIELENECTAASECTVLPIGARACGGPGGYTAYAISSSNSDEIHSLAQLTTTLQRKYNEQNQIMSICSIVPQPSAICNASHKCVTGPANNIFVAERK